MEQSNAPAFPTIRNVEHNPNWETEYGLTKREYFAAKAMQGLLADPNITNMENAAEVAVRAAGALIAELEK